MQEIEETMMSLFASISPHLAELESYDFGNISVECLSSENLVGSIEVGEDDEDGFIQLQLFMIEGNDIRLVKSQPYPFFDEDEEDGSSFNSSADLRNDHPRETSLGAGRNSPRRFRHNGRLQTENRIKL